MRSEMIKLHRETDALLQKEGVAMGMTYLEGHDIHTFLLLLKDPSKLIHVQGYPGLSTRKYASIGYRLLDTYKWLEILGKGNQSIGNEHLAAVQDHATWGHAHVTDFNAEYLAQMLKGALSAREYMLRSTTV